MLKDFRKRTGSDGVIRIYGDLCVDSIDGYDFYEIMELAEIDWDEEILFRGKYHYYYQENDLMAIMRQIVETFSLLQKNHITHRDIKPQNIMIVDGKFKICDFGNARILKKEGYVIQRIRGSEMYMSPVLFKGFHAKMAQVKHNTFKSDVFSLGMCFLLAASSEYNQATEKVILVNSNGLNLVQKNNYYYFVLQCVAHEGEQTKSGYDFFFDNDFSKFDAKKFAEKVVNQTVGQLGGEACASNTYKAVLHPDVVTSLLRAYIGHANAEEVQKKSSAFIGKLAHACAKLKPSADSSGALSSIAHSS